MVASISPEPTKVSESTLTPTSNFTVAPLAKSDPMIRTASLVPRAPVDGATEVTRGPGSIVRQPAQVPAAAPGFVTVTSRLPVAAPGATEIRTTSCDRSVDVIESTVTPEPETETAAPFAKFDPSIFTCAFVAPCPSDAGLTEATAAEVRPAGRC